MNQGFRAALAQREQLRQELADVMAADRASGQRRSNAKKVFFVACLAGGAAFAKNHWPSSSPKAKKDILAEFKLQLQDEQALMIGATTPPPPAGEKNAYESSSELPEALRSDARRAPENKDYAPAGAAELELIRLARAPATNLANCAQSYYPLTPAQSAGLPPQYQKVVRPLSHLDYQLQAVLPIDYQGEKKEFPDF